MARYILRRFLQMIPLLLGITFISFVIIQLAPGDYLSQQRLYNPDISPETLEQMRRQFGLDQPLHVQYLKWLWGVLHLDFGYSFQYKMPTLELLASRMLATLLLGLTSTLFAWLVALPIGIHAATHPYSWSDRLLSVFAFLGLSVPNFFLAFLLIFFVVSRGLDLPIQGLTSVDHKQLSPAGQLMDYARHLLLPTVVLGTASLAGLMRYMRGNLLEILGEDFIRTARAKGLPERRVIYRHAVRNAINPLITLFGYDLASLLSGAALTENVFGYPGLGRLVLQAVLSYDLYVVMGALFLSGVLLVVGNLVADVLLALADPRIRYT